MDHRNFNKDIMPYLIGELDDEELNDFLHHLAICPSCSEELEINFIMIEGVKILDRENFNYDMTEAFKKYVRRSIRYIRNKKLLIRLAYVFGTFAFWSVLAAVFMFFRIMYTGI